MAWANLKD